MMQSSVHQASKASIRTSKNVDDDDFATRHVFTLGDRFFQVSKMWELTANTPTTLQPAASFRTNLSYPVWGVTPNEVLSHPGAYPEHYGRIQRADMKYPIIMYNGYIRNTSKAPALMNYEWLFLSHAVLDGYHRLSRTQLDGLTYVNTVYLTDQQLAQCEIFPNYD